MQNFIKKKLSGSTSGMPIKVAATATAGTLLHTARALTGAEQYDELWVAFTNTHTSSVDLTIEYGGVTDPDNLIVKALNLPPRSALRYVLDGYVIQNGLIIRAFASTANVLLASGWVFEIG